MMYRFKYAILGRACNGTINRLSVVLQGLGATVLRNLACVVDDHVPSSFSSEFSM